MADHQRGIQTVELAGQILRLISSSYKPLSLSEIAEHLDMVPGSVYKYLVSMLRTGLLKRNESTLEFEPGSLCLRLGLAHINHDPLLKDARIELTQLAEKYQVNVFVSMWSDACGATVVFYKEYGGFFNIGFRLGITLSLTHTATGRLFTTYYEQESLQEFIHHQTDFFDETALQKSVEKIKQQGYSSLIDSPTPNISSYAVPVFDQKNKMILGLTAFGQTQHLDQQKSDQIVYELKAIAKNLSRDS